MHIAAQKPSPPLRPLFSSARSDWCTPPSLLARVRELAPIGLDPCSNECSIVGASVEWTVREDGLSRPWSGRGLVFVNPPYSRATITAWVAKCAAEGRATDVIGLVPARTDTRWWHAHCAPSGAHRAGGLGSAAVCFLRGRLRFLGARQAATFPSAVVYWGAGIEAFTCVFASAGKLWVAR